MVFSSITFLFFFLPFVLLVYFIMPNHMWKNVFFTICSFLFYAWDTPAFLLLMCTSIVINYVGGVLLQALRNKILLRKLWFILIIMINLGLLFYFKYFNFAISTVNSLFSSSFPLQEIILPIGISFFTFQGMSYVIDLYRNEISVQKNPLYVALYISMFPQLIAGPIVRYKDVNFQIENRSVTLDSFAEGMRRFVIGLSKKVIIANDLGQVADSIINGNLFQTSASVAWFGAICYTMQIFFDFSGYSDMAIGLGKMFGFTFMENFNYPYISRSITEFWRRWHISLSSFFKDYLYIPLGGNRKGNVYVNLLVVFICTGLWHGASFNFLFWGLWHGLFILLEKALTRKKKPVKIHFIIKYGYTCLVIIIGWIIFRIEDLSALCQYLKVMFGAYIPNFTRYGLFYYCNVKTLIVLLIAVLISLGLYPYLKEKLQKKINISLLAQTIAKNSGILVLLMISIIWLLNSTYNPFIYFRF